MGTQEPGTNTPDRILNSKVTKEQQCYQQDMQNLPIYVALNK